jgi:hypothetical protein
MAWREYPERRNGRVLGTAFSISKHLRQDQPRFECRLPLPYSWEWRKELHLTCQNLGRKKDDADRRSFQESTPYIAFLSGRYGKPRNADVGGRLSPPLGER